jgi:hypothetical protein
MSTGSPIWGGGGGGLPIKWEDWFIGTGTTLGLTVYQVLVTANRSSWDKRKSFLSLVNSRFSSFIGDS